MGLDAELRVLEDDLSAGDWPFVDRGVTRIGFGGDIDDACLSLASSCLKSESLNWIPLCDFPEYIRVRVDFIFVLVFKSEYGCEGLL